MVRGVRLGGEGVGRGQAGLRGVLIRHLVTVTIVTGVVRVVVKEIGEFARVIVPARDVIVHEGFVPQFVYVTVVPLVGGGVTVVHVHLYGNRGGGV